MDTSDFIAEAITDYWGERCPDYVGDCSICTAWKQYDTQRVLLKEAEEALRHAEAKLVSLYRGATPQASYDNELTIKGHVSGNRFADKDEDVAAVRTTLAKLEAHNAE